MLLLRNKEGDTSMFRRKTIWFLPLLLTAALCVNCLPGAGFAAGAAEYEAVSSPEELTSGCCQLRISDTVAAGVYTEGESPFVSAVSPGDAGAVWTLTVTGSGVILTDAAGISIAPSAGEGNGISAGAYSWTVFGENGLFRFLGMAGDTMVMLAYNTETGNFRAYDSFAVEGYPEGYLTGFSLYRVTEPEDPAPEETLPEPTETVPEDEETVPQEPPGPKLYFGRLHGHTCFSDGNLTPEEVFAAARAEGMDFCGITDHGDSLTRERWDAGRAAAGDGEDFLALWGYEMSWPEEMQLGHIGTFGTADFAGWQEEPYRTYDNALENYYAALADMPESVSQFHHPGALYGDFKGFAYVSEEADEAVALLEVVGGEGRCYDAYTAALDAGWHVAPTNNGDSRQPDSGGRTAVVLESLSEENLLSALKDRRVYATEDNDLEITYALNGFPMGTRLEKRQVGETLTLTATLGDKTDETIGLVEVIAGGGAVLAEETPETNPARVEFSLPGNQAYYYLRITQPDGEMAVTAPVWIDGEEDVAITAFTCTPAVPVQNQPAELRLTLQNGEKAHLQLERTEIFADGTPVFVSEEAVTVAPESEACLTASYTHTGLGDVELTAVVTATLDGQPRTYRQTLHLNWRRQDMVSGILVDGSHGNTCLNLLNRLTSLAAEKNISVTVEEGTVTEALLGNSALLLVTAPAEPFSEEFLAAVSAFVEHGGSLLVCGGPEKPTGELNRLLEAAGVSLRLLEENVSGTVRFREDAPLCRGISPGQIWYPEPSRALEPGRGTWLAQADKPIMAFESCGKGTVYACGSLFLADAALEPGKNLWDTPWANRTLVQNLLGIHRTDLPVSTVREARTAEGEQVLRLRGYVTAGTSNPCNTFPQTLYLQDATGGIAVLPFREPGIPVGTAMEITGSPVQYEGDRVLEPISWEILEYPLYNHLPLKLTCAGAGDYDACGGLLVQVEGICTQVQTRQDGTVCGFTLKDSSGKSIAVVVEDGILSGATGRNDLHRQVKPKRDIRAVGLLWVDERGTPVIRVRNCDEVVYISPIPYTGDSMGKWLAAMTVSAAALWLLVHNEKKNCRS